MYLYKFKIQNFKRLEDIEVFLGNTTFIIGENNCGKSSVLQALEILLSDKKKLEENYHFITSDSSTEKKTVVLEAEFRNLPIESEEWRGFKGRIIQYHVEGENNDTGLKFTYKKTFELGKDVLIEVETKERSLKSEYTECKTGNNFITAGLDQDLLSDIYDDLEKSLSPKERESLELINELWDVDDSKVWFKNPGGIAPNVLSKLPKFILIPTDSSSDELTVQNKKSALYQTLLELFELVRNESENFIKAQTHLSALAKELDPDNKESDFGKMMVEINHSLNSVFPETQLHIKTDLDKPDDVIKPIFDVTMSSNVVTPIIHQGTGMIRTAVFGILRFREQWLFKQHKTPQRSLIIGFEEPELYLHPNASNQMRDAIYDLSNNSLQIIATTHSPYLIDLDRKPKQVLNSFRKIERSSISNTPFNISDEFKKLQEDDKTYLKMLLAIDDRVSRAFFAEKIIIVEGNTEEIVLKESLKLLPNKEQYKKIMSNFEIINARGKATIISLVKYLVAMQIEPIVIHDRDGETDGAKKFNEPIKNAIGTSGKVIQLIEEIEDILGYPAPNAEKPYRAYVETQKWKTWEKIPKKWQSILKDVFAGYI